jgi:DNA mismatch repair ATPase MutS
MCDAGEVGRLWSKWIIMGSKTAQDTALQFKMLPAEVMDHVNNHEIVVNEEKGIYESPDLLMNELLKILKQLKDWMKYISTIDYDKDDIDTFVKLTKELRETIKVMGEFQGKLNKGNNVNVNVAMINQRYEQFTYLLMDEVCEDCRLKVLNLMDHLDEAGPKKIMEPIKITSST